MKKRTAGKEWFPFWIDKWIFGSMRIEFNAEERGIWIDFLALASKDSGYIRANEDTPYPLMQLSGMLLVPEDKLERAINSFIEKKKIKKYKNKTLKIIKWEKYQFSERWVRKIEKSRGNSENPEGCAVKPEPIEYNKILHRKNLKVSKKVTNLVSKARNGKNRSGQPPKVDIIFNRKTGKFEGVKQRDITAWAEAYPACDVMLEIKKAAAWAKANPKKAKKNWHRFINTWLNTTQEGGGTKGYLDKVGRDEWAKKKAQEAPEDDNGV